MAPTPPPLPPVSGSRDESGPKEASRTDSPKQKRGKAAARGGGGSAGSQSVGGDGSHGAKGGGKKKRAESGEERDTTHLDSNEDKNGDVGKQGSSSTLDTEEERLTQGSSAGGGMTAESARRRRRATTMASRKRTRSGVLDAETAPDPAPDIVTATATSTSEVFNDVFADLMRATAALMRMPRSSALAYMENLYRKLGGTGLPPAVGTTARVTTMQAQSVALAAENSAVASLSVGVDTASVSEAGAETRATKRQRKEVAEETGRGKAGEQADGSLPSQSETKRANEGKATGVSGQSPSESEIGARSVVASALTCLVAPQPTAQAATAVTAAAASMAASDRHPVPLVNSPLLNGSVSRSGTSRVAPSSQDGATILALQAAPRTPATAQAATGVSTVASPGPTSGRDAPPPIPPLAHAVKKLYPRRSQSVLNDTRDDILTPLGWQKPKEPSINMDGAAMKSLRPMKIVAEHLEVMLCAGTGGKPESALAALKYLLQLPGMADVARLVKEDFSKDCLCGRTKNSLDAKIVDGLRDFLAHHSNPRGGTRPRHEQFAVETVLVAAYFGGFPPLESGDRKFSFARVGDRLGVSDTRLTNFRSRAEAMRRDGSRIQPLAERKQRSDCTRPLAVRSVHEFCHSEESSALIVGELRAKKPYTVVNPDTGEKEKHRGRVWLDPTWKMRYERFKCSDIHKRFEEETGKGIGHTVFRQSVCSCVREPKEDGEEVEAEG